MNNIFFIKVESANVFENLSEMILNVPNIFRLWQYR